MLKSILAENNAYRLLLTCGPADNAAKEALLESLSISPEEKEQINAGHAEFNLPLLSNRALLAGNLSFLRWTALLSHCQLIITPDTGALHLASALQKPVVAIYSPKLFHQNSHQWCPWKVPNRILTFASYDELAPLILNALTALLSEKKSQGETAL